MHKRKNEKGFATINRGILEWGWYGDPNTRSVFMHLIITANFAPHDYMGYTINRGQAVTGYPALAKTLGISVQNVRTAFKNLKSTGEVTVNVTRKFSIVTLCNYELYNKSKPSPNSQVNSLSNSHPTGIQQSSNNTKEEEEEKQEKEILCVFDFWNKMGVKKHRDITKFRPSINSALKLYCKEEITDAIQNYREIADGTDYWYSYLGFTLDKFLSQKNGIDNFLSINNPWKVYKNKEDGFAKKPRNRNEDGSIKVVL